LGKGGGPPGKKNLRGVKGKGPFITGKRKRKGKMNDQPNHGTLGKASKKKKKKPRRRVPKVAKRKKKGAVSETTWTGLR